MAGAAGRSGGVRAGAGRKPVDRAVLGLRGGETRRAQAKTTTVVGALPVLPAPRGLPEDQRAVWDELAPLAATARTLTAETAQAFRDLCEAIVLKRQMLVQILADGLMQTRLSTKMDEDGGGEQVFESKAHPLLARYQAQVGRVETKQARFLLEATGKPAVVAEKTVDPFDEFEGTVQ